VELSRCSSGALPLYLRDSIANRDGIAHGVATQHMVYRALDGGQRGRYRSPRTRSGARRLCSAAAAADGITATFAVAIRTANRRWRLVAAVALAARNKAAWHMLVPWDRRIRRWAFEQERQRRFEKGRRDAARAAVRQQTRT